MIGEEWFLSFRELVRIMIKLVEVKSSAVFLDAVMFTGKFAYGHRPHQISLYAVHYLEDAADFIMRLNYLGQEAHVARFLWNTVKLAFGRSILTEYVQEVTVFLELISADGWRDKSLLQIVLLQTSRSNAERQACLVTILNQSALLTRHICFPQISFASISLAIRVGGGSRHLLTYINNHRTWLTARELQAGILWVPHRYTALSEIGVGDDDVWGRREEDVSNKCEFVLEETMGKAKIKEE